MIEQNSSVTGAAVWPAIGLTTAWTAVGVCLYVTVPEFAPFILPLSLVAPVLWHRCQGIAPDWSYLDALFATTFAYLLLNASWSTAPSRAYLAVATFLAAALTIHFSRKMVWTLTAAPLRAMAIGLYAGYVLIGALFSIEIGFQNPLHMAFLTAFPKLIPQSSSMVVESGILKQIRPEFFNTRIAALVFLFWPAALIAGRLASTVPIRVGLGAGLLPVVAAVFWSEHQTSMLALLGGGLVWLFYQYAPRAVRLSVGVAWILVCLAIVPLASASYKAQLYRAPLLWESAKARIVIWGVVANKISEAPFFGQGISSGREIGLSARQLGRRVPGTDFTEGPGPHAHSVYLQIWFETGAVGALLLVCTGLLVLSAIGRTASELQTSLYSAFASSALLAASSFSMWRPLFLASFALSALSGLLAASFGTCVLRARQPPAPKAP